MGSKLKYKLALLALTSALGVHCGTSVSNPAPGPSAAPIVASFTTTSGTAIGTTGSTDVPIASAFSITFSTAMDLTTLTTSTLTLSCDSTSQTVTVATVGNNGATITPSSSMPEGATCIVTATTGVKSSGGVAMATAATFTFTTASSTPTVPTVSLAGTLLSSGASTTIATTGTTGISGAVAAPLTMTFSTAMSNSTVTSGTSFQCPSGTTLTPTLATSDNTVYTITPLTTAFPQMTACVLTLPATITNSSGTALAATTYTYTTGCGTSDNFSNSATFSSSSTICWTPSNAGNASTFAISGGNLVIATSTSTTAFTQPNAAKTFAAGTNTITITALLAYSGIEDSSDRCILQIFETPSNSAAATIYFNTGAIRVNGAVGEEEPVDIASPGTPIYLRIAIASGTATVSYSSDGTEFTPVTSGAFTNPSSTLDLSLSARSDGTNTTTCTFQDFTVTGATATGQYNNN